MMEHVEISDFELSKSLFSGGDEVVAGFTLKNVATDAYGKRLAIFGITFALQAVQPGKVGVDISNSVRMFQWDEIPYGSSVKVNATFKIDQEYETAVNNYFEENPETRILPVSMHIWMTYEDAGWASTMSDAYETSALFLRSYCKPQVAVFELDRSIAGTPSDEGQDVLASMKIALADSRNIPALSLLLHYAENSEATTESDYIDLTAKIPDLLSGVTDSTELIFRQFSNGSNWDFLLFFGDEYESVTAKESLSRAFANLHLSGAKTGGACFGGFSSSSEGDPKLESYYPGYFYGGIHGVSIFSYQEVKTGGRWADNKPLYTKVLALTDATSRRNHDIAAPEDIENAWVDPSGSFCISSSGSVYPVSYMGTDGTAVFQAQYRPDLKAVRVATYTGATADFYIKIFYTKTTDEAITPVQTHAQMIDADDLLVTDMYGMSFYAEEYDDSVYKSKWSGSQIDTGIANALNALLLTGGTMTGMLTLAADPTTALGAATKQYVDNLINNIKLTPGTTFIPSVSEDGVISWTNDGGLANPVPVNIKGPEGDPGYTPQKGIDYFDGAPGVGIVDITIEEVV